MLARAARAVLAMALVATAGALGDGLLWAGGAQAASSGSSCGNSCPPAGTITGIQTTPTGGTVTVTWSANEPSGVVQESGAMAPTILVAWNLPPDIPVPSNAVQPNPTSAKETGSCTGSDTSTITCTYSWPTQLLVDGYVLNGTYQVTAEAYECSTLLAALGCVNAPVSQSIATSVGAKNSPAPPTGVKAVPTADGSQVTISWDPNPEPDIADYQVVRNDGTVVCTIGSTTPVPTSYSCTDAPPKDGSYSYEVVVFRYGATYTNTVANDAVTHSAPTTPVAVTGTSANTSTTVTGTGTGGLGSAGFTATPSPDKDAKSDTGSGTFNAAPAPAVVAPATATTIDPGFDPTLPYGTTLPPTPGTNPTAIATPSTHKGGNSVGTIAAFGAGLLIAVIALQGLWLRAEVRRSGALEVLEPEH